MIVYEPINIIRLKFYDSNYVIIIYLAFSSEGNSFHCIHDIAIYVVIVVFEVLIQDSLLSTQTRYSNHSTKQWNYEIFPTTKQHTSFRSILTLQKEISRKRMNRVMTVQHGRLTGLKYELRNVPFTHLNGRQSGGMEKTEL